MASVYHIMMPSFSFYRHDSRISHDSEARLSPDVAKQPSDGDGSVLQTEAAVSLFSPLSHSHSGARSRRAPISPLSCYRSSLPHLGEGFNSLVDSVRLPIADEGRPPMLGIAPNSGVLSGLRSPIPLVNVNPPLTSPGAWELSSSKTPNSSNSTAPIESYQEKHHKSVSPENSSDEIKRTEELKEDVTVHTEPLCIEPSPTTGNTRRPRLGTLRQTSLESFCMESLPEDMSEIELLTGDLHSPVLSTRRPFKRQEVG